MHPGGEDGVDEACGVADEDHAVAPETSVGVRVVLADTDLAVGALGDTCGVGEHVLHDLAAINVVQQCLLLRIERMLGLLARDDRTDTGQAVRQRDVPDPPLVESRTQDVAAIGCGEPLAVLEVSEHRDILEEVGVDTFSACVFRQPRRVPRRVDDEPRIDLVLDPVCVQVTDTCDPTRLVGDGLVHAAPLTHVDALPRGVLKQYLVELHAFDLIGVRPLTRELGRDGEQEVPRHGILAPPEASAALVHEPGVLDLLIDAEEPAHAVNR